MNDIIKMTLFGCDGWMILTDDGKRGLFAYRDKGEREQKRKGKNLAPVMQTWDKVWVCACYKSERASDMPWKYARAGGKYPFSKLMMDADELSLLVKFLPFLFKEFFGESLPWDTPKETKTAFVAPTQDDEADRLLRELAVLTG